MAVKITIGDICNTENLDNAMEHLLRKRNSCGIDNVYLSDFKEYWEINRESILQQICENTYEPAIILEKEIVGYNGKRRKITLFTCTDRLILRAIVQVLQPHCEAIFSPHSHGYRQDRGVHTAIQEAVNAIENGNSWVAEIDIANFFDNILISEMESVLYQTFEVDESIRNLLQRYLHCRIEADGTIREKRRGIVLGSPLSPLLSNLYVHKLDMTLEACGYAFVRFSDDLNIYAEDSQEAFEAYEIAERELQKAGLSANHQKSGVYEADGRIFLGYQVKKEKKTGAVIAQRFKNKPMYYQNWNHTSLQRIDKNYHLIHDGILTKKDYTLLFENESGKKYLPVETVNALNIYSNTIFTSQFFEFASKKRLRVGIFDKYGNCLGSFVPPSVGAQGRTMLKQAELYLDKNRRLEMAKKLSMAAMHNLRANLRYYLKRNKTDTLNEKIQAITEAIKEMNEVTSLETLMLVEARGRQTYYQSFDAIIHGENFRFEKRTKRPPRNAMNALISFGNVFLYNRIATEIQKTSLDIRIGFVHAANNRAESLNLDISELFKPIIVDRAIFTLVNKKMINEKTCFHTTDNGGVYLSQQGKRILIAELEKKIYAKIKNRNEQITYDTMIRNEIQKILRTVLYGENYKPYKYTT